MKIREEISGIHFFDRITGLHILLDEYKMPPESCSVAPRTVSIALTNICDLKCGFCYVPKSKDLLPLNFVLTLAKKLDDLGSLEITLGGGEPLLYPFFSELCTWIWDNTSLGISVTTHGHHLSPRLISEITGKISSIRFSIDGIEPYYSEVKGKPLHNLLNIISSIQGKIPFGINTVVSPGKLPELVNVIELAIDIGSQNMLIIPEHRSGNFNLSEYEWQELNNVINDYKSRTQLYITYDAYNFLNVNCLETEVNNEFLFAHVSADKKLKMNSFNEDGIQIEDINRLEEYFITLKHSQGGHV